MSVPKRLFKAKARLALAALPLLLVAVAVPAVSAPAAAIKNPFLDSLQKNYYVEVCKSKLGDAVKKKSGCRVASRLNEFVLWMDSIGGAPHDSVYGNALKAHYASLASRNRYAADIRGWPLVGEVSAPLTVVMYFSGTCPLCKRNFAELYHEVTRGRLRGKVRIVAKPFGVNSVNKALVAAQDMGPFVNVMLALAHIDGRVDEETVYDIAESMRLDREKFKAAAESQSVADRVNASYAEGKKNGVELVPTYLIGGRRYESVSNTWWIVDTFEYMVDEVGAGKK